MTQNYPVRELMQIMVSTIGDIIGSLSEEETNSFLTLIEQAKRIYVAGAGRSGFVAKAFAMRLMHLGMTSYVVGETVTPAFLKTDTLIAFSGSGKTDSILEVCQTVQKIGGTLCLITATRDSPMAKLAGYKVILDTSEPGYTKEGSDHFAIRQLTGEHRSLSHPCAPIGTLFETCALILTDSIITALIERKHCNMEDIVHRYSNMQ